MSQRSDFEILRDLDQALDKLPDDKDPNKLIQKAKEEEMATKQKVKDKENRVQVGSWIDKQLWQQLKAQAALESRGAGYVMDDAIRLYIQTQKENQGKQLY